MSTDAEDDAGHTRTMEAGNEHEHQPLLSDNPSVAVAADIFSELMSIGVPCFVALQFGFAVYSFFAVQSIDAVGQVLTDQYCPGAKFRDILVAI